MDEIEAIQEILSVITFNPETQEFLDSKGKDRKRKNSRGYWFVRVGKNKVTYQAYCHRIIYYFHHRGLPDHKISFAGSKDDLRLGNLLMKSGNINFDASAKIKVWANQKDAIIKLLNDNGYNVL